MIILSRSAIDTYNVCPQKFFLNNLWNNHGLTIGKSDLDLTIGSAIHSYYEYIYNQNLGDNWNHSNEVMETGIQIALDYFNNHISNNPLELKPYEIDSELVIEEHLALIEALCYTYWINKFEEHHTRFKFLEIEREDFIKLGTITINGIEEEIIYVLKADGTWLNRDNNLLYVLSNKVISGYMPVTARNYQQSSQNVSELLGLNLRLQQLIERIYKGGERINSNPLEQEVWKIYSNGRIKIKANHILYNLLIKGQRKEEPYGSGIYRRNAPLIRPYKFQPNITASPFANLVNLANETQQIDLGNYKLTLGSGRPPKGWEKVNIWQDMGIRNFIDSIKKGLIQPENGNYLDRITIEPEDDIFKTDDEISSFEQRLQYKILNDIVPKIKNVVENNMSPNVVFDMDTTRCWDFYGKSCPFVEYCHDNGDIEQDLSLNVLKVRTPHHDLELEMFKKKGYLE